MCPVIEEPTTSISYMHEIDNTRGKGYAPPAAQDANCVEENQRTYPVLDVDGVRRRDEERDLRIGERKRGERDRAVDSARRAEAR